MNMKKWMFNDELRENDWSSHYFVDQVEQEQQQEQESLLEKIGKHSFVTLYGTPASGKSTRVLRTISVLEDVYICNYLSFNQVNITGVGFWNSLCINLFINNSIYFKPYKNINCSEDFLRFFSTTGWEEAGNDSNDRIILFFDDFDMIYEMDENIRSNFLSVLCAIRNDIKSYVIQAIIIIGTFKILHIDSKSSATSPFNIKDSIHHPNFTFDQVQMLFKEFGKDYRIEFEQEVIDDIFEQTNGHAGLVCICGREIEVNLIRKLDNGRLRREIWERYKAESLMNAIIQYRTFIRMVRSLQNHKNEMTFFRNYFLVDFGFERKITTNININSAEYLAAEGVLIPGKEVGTFKLSSPLIRWVVVQYVLPIVFPSYPERDIPLVRERERKRKSIPFLNNNCA